jgi:hypothetical protein
MTGNIELCTQMIINTPTECVGNTAFNSTVIEYFVGVEN